MLNPSPADLLRGVAEALDETVLPDLPRGAPRSQVQAAIGIVRRCAAAMEAHGPILYAECVDLVGTIRLVTAADGQLVDDRAALDGVLVEADLVMGAEYPSVGQLTALALELHEVLEPIAVQAEQLQSTQCAAIRGLFGRQLARAQDLGLSPW